MNKLEDLEYIASIDASSALDFAIQQIGQLNSNLTLSNIVQYDNLNNIVFSGMGGSALCAEFFKVWPQELSLPFEITRSYNTPRYVNENTLYIASSFSGNTEEILSGIEEAMQKQANIVVITSGGRLLEFAKEHNLPVCLIDNTIPQPRMAVMSFIYNLTCLFVELGLIKPERKQEVEHSAKFLKQEVVQMAKNVSMAENPAKQIALKLYDRSVVVYSSNLMKFAGYKWKININENAKTIAWLGTYPEFDHNEFIGWSNQSENINYQVVNLISEFDHPKVQKRFTLSDELLKEHRSPPVNVMARGSSVLEQSLYLTLLGDFVTLYISALEGVDPTPVYIVEKLKSQL